MYASIVLGLHITFLAMLYVLCRATKSHAKMLLFIISQVEQSFNYLDIHSISSLKPDQVCSQTESVINIPSELPLFFLVI